MNKARKKTHKTGIGKRLVRGSLVLSFTRFVSSRLVRIFESGFAAPLLKSVKATDHFARKKVSGPVFKKLGLRKKFAMPARNRVASFFANNSLITRLCGLQTKLLNTPLRTVGLFMLTFGIYATAIFLLKRFVSLSIGEADTDDLIISALSVIGGIMLTLFGEKRLVSALGKGKITGTLLSDVLGINDSSLYRTATEKPKTYVGISFLLGSVLGVLTVVLSPLKIFFWTAVLIGAVIIINVPEFGLLTAMSAMYFLPASYLSIICVTTLLSYLLKCLRLKRNFRFGSADVLFLLFALCLLICCARNGMNLGELYLLCFVSMYFVAKNTLCSEKLVIQASNSICLGAFVGMLLYIAGDFAHLIQHQQLRMVLNGLVYCRMDVNMLAVMVATAIPFAFSSFSTHVPRHRNVLFLILAAACAFISDSYSFYMLLAAAFLVYVAVAHKAPFGAMAFGALTMPTFAVLVSDFTYSSAVNAFCQTGFDSLLGIAGSNLNFWSALNQVGGAAAVVLFLLSLLLIMQRALAGAIMTKFPTAGVVCGTVAASAIIIVAESFAFNLFADIRTLLMLGFVLGMCGAVYKVYYNTGKEE